LVHDERTPRDGYASKVIGLVIPTVENPFFPIMSRAIDSTAHARGYGIMLASTQDDPKREAAAIDFMLDQRVSGLIILPSRFEETAMKKAIGSGLPVAILDRPERGPNIIPIVVRDSDGTYQATKLLFDLGHRRIAFVGGEFNIPAVAARFQGYKRALADVGLQFDENLVCERPLNVPGSGELAVDQILEHHPTAIVAANDLLATGVITRLQALHLDVPGDISVVGFGNVQLSELITPSLTTVAFPANSLGKAVTTAIINMIQSEEPLSRPNSPLVFRTDLVVRQSTAPPKKA
jgi:LacI family transcriptional regulator/LacI family repressor for deo operon, udp, cdd, tsx, nupC, and nupG